VTGFLFGFLFITCSVVVVEVVVVVAWVLGLSMPPRGASVMFRVVVAVVVVVVGGAPCTPPGVTARPGVVVVAPAPATTEVAPVLVCVGGCPPSDAAVDA